MKSSYRIRELVIISRPSDLLSKDSPKTVIANRKNTVSYDSDHIMCLVKICS